jgi:two-component system response regulator AtoC
MDPALQAKLLRVLQQREFERVGGTQTISVDVRILSATHRDLHGMVDEGLFREDLFYRLNSFPIVLPPLRERHTDILVLAQHFLDTACEREQRPALQLAPETAEKLRTYSWPGNIRELQSAIDRAVLLNEHPDELRPEALPHWMPRVSDTPRPRPGEAPNADALPADASGEVLPLEEVKKQALLHALQHTSWNVKEAARLLGIGRTTIYRMLDEYSIDSTRADA